MPKINTGALTAGTLSNLPNVLAQTIAGAAQLPGLTGAVSHDLGHGRTAVSAAHEKLGGFSAIFKNYAEGDHQTPGATVSHRVVTGGTLQVLANTSGDETVQITKLGLDAGTLLDIYDDISGGDAESILTLTHGLDWEIVGGAGDDLFLWTSSPFFTKRMDAIATNHMFAGNDRFDGQGGDDTIRLYGGRDTGLGGSGSDKIFGNSGRDTLKGQAGNDALFGGTGKDKLRGGTGDDTLDGGLGNDLMIGGPGADVFLFNANAGNDRIRHFDPDQDTIVLDDGVSGVRIVETAKGVRIVHTEGHIHLIGVEMDQIDTGDIFGWLGF